MTIRNKRVYKKGKVTVLVPSPESMNQCAESPAPKRLTRAQLEGQVTDLRMREEGDRAQHLQIVKSYQGKIQELQDRCAEARRLTMMDVIHGLSSIAEAAARVALEFAKDKKP